MAGNATAIRAGKAFVELGTKDDKLREGLRKAQERLERWGASIQAVGQQLAGLGVAGIAGLGGLALHFADAAVDAGNLSLRTGVALDEIQALAGVAGGVETLDHAFDHLSESINDARTGSGEAADTFAKLRLSVADLIKMRPDQQFKAVAEAISKANAGQQASLTKGVFSKAGLEMLPLLRQGAGKIEELEKRFRESHQIFTPEDVATAKEFKLTISALTGNLERVGFAIGKAVLPYLQMWVTDLIPVIGKVVTWIDANQEAIVTIAEISGAAVAAGVAIYGLGQAFTAVGAIAGGLYTALSFVLNPFTLLPALAVGGIAAVLYFAGAFDGMTETLKESWGGVVDAIRAGDMQLAWQVVIKGGEVLWLGFRNWFADLWDNISLVVTGAGLEIEKSLSGLIGRLTTGWINFQQLIGLTSAAAADQARAVVSAQQSALESASDAAMSGFIKEQGAGKDARDKQLADLQAQLQELTKTASKEAAAAKMPRGMADIPPPGLPPPPGLRGESVGSFSAAAAGGLGLGTSTSGYLQSTAESGRATAANTAAMAANLAALGTVA